MNDLLCMHTFLCVHVLQICTHIHISVLTYYDMYGMYIIPVNMFGVVNKLN